MSEQRSAATAEFKPSHVALEYFFVGTFDHLEAENTAAVIVKVLAMNGDAWRSATGEELSAGFQELTKDDGMWRRRFNNPFIKIDMHDLVKRGFAEWDEGNCIRFTDKGLDRMRRWVIRNLLRELESERSGARADVAELVEALRDFVENGSHSRGDRVSTRGRELIAKHSEAEKV